MRYEAYDVLTAARERAARRALTAAIIVSLLVHALALWRMPQLNLRAEELGIKQSALEVQLVPRGAPPARPRPPRPSQAQRLAPPRPPRVERRRSPPPTIARRNPGLAAPRVRPPTPPPAPPVAPSPRSSAPGDLASYIEARRRARGEASPAAPAAAAPAPSRGEDENARANRIAAANLGLDRKLTFGPDPRQSGGVFEVTRMTYDYAEFLFYGWNRDIRRNTSQLIEVRKGDNSDIRIAVVRRMIAIIREYEQGDFVWESPRLDRNVTLSARQRDTAGLEDFLMREFFEERRPASR